jgi:hypothetical protein
MITMAFVPVHMQADHERRSAPCVFTELEGQAEIARESGKCSS